MKVLLCRSLGPGFEGLAVEDLTMPQPRAGEVLVAVKAAAVNFPDVLMTKGLYQLKPDLPFVPGMELSGTVVESLDGAFKPGEEVVAGLRFGAFAAFVAVPATQLRKKPHALDFAEGAAFSTAALTAYVALQCRARIERGEWLLVLGAAGGVGMAAVDLGVHLGARVIAAASSEAKRQAVLLRGAEHVIAPGPGMREIVKSITSGRGADVVFDPVGGEAFAEASRAIAFDGRYLVIGFASGHIPTLPVNLPLIKGYSLMGVRAGEYGRQYPERGLANLAAIDALASQGVFRPLIGARFALADAVAALRHLDERRVIGKAVIEMDRSA